MQYSQRKKYVSLYYSVFCKLNCTLVAKFIILPIVVVDLYRLEMSTNNSLTLPISNSRCVAFLSPHDLPFCTRAGNEPLRSLKFHKYTDKDTDIDKAFARHNIGLLFV